MMGVCDECGTELEVRENGTVGFHASERYRTCPGSMKPARDEHTHGAESLDEVSAQTRKRYGLDE